MSWVAEVDPVTSSFITGRLRRGLQSNDPPVSIELWIDGAFESSETPAADEPEPVEYRMALPVRCFDAQEHLLEIRCAGQVHKQRFQSEYQGFIDPFSNNLLTGWGVDLSRPGTPVEIDIDLNGVSVARVCADIFRPDLNARQGFRHPLREVPEMARSFVLRARIASTDIDLQKSPVLSLSRPRLVKAAQQLNSAFHYLEQRLMWEHGGRGPELRLSPEERRTFAELLLEGTNVADLLELRHRFLQPIQTQLTERYARRDFATLGSDYAGSVPRRSRGAHRDRPIDVIVPIYAGARETERCIGSVIDSPAGCRYELICVLDRPDGPEIGAMVRAFARDHPRIEVLENAVNEGFAESVNRAMRLHRDRDVVVLHSDCEVHGDWLLRLQSAAYQGSGAGLVNPLTDHAEFLSYGLQDELPEDAPLARLDSIARQANAGQTVRIPGAMGFCLFVRRGCLDDLGFFHNDRASGGYYAEKYFSVNAAALGWPTVLAADVFVKHRGFVSFSRKDAQALEEARDAFERWCPFYRDSVTDFLVDDPSLPARRELDLARLESLGGDVFCLITHGVGGGTERHLHELTEALALDGIRTVVLYAISGRRAMLRTAFLAEIENLRYSLDGEFERLIVDLKRLRVSHVHLHSNVEIPDELFELPNRLGTPYDVTVHDYGWFCPRVNLVNRSGSYCGEPPVSVCETCAGGGVAALRERSRFVLARARRVFCPSEDTRDRMQRQFDLPNLLVRPHPEWIGEPEWLPAELRAGEKVRVACIGRLSGHKGLGVLRKTAAYALEWGLPLEFVVIGSIPEDAHFRGLTNLEITGPYTEDEVDLLVERHGVGVALLPSIWPETYSYTLSIALRCGLTPVAFDFGAMGERIRRAQRGILLPLDASAARITKALLEAARQQNQPAPRLGKGYLNMLRDYYVLNPD